MKDNTWAYKRARITGKVEACYTLEFLRKTMATHITDSRHQTNLSEMCVAFQQGRACELSPDVTAMAAL